MNNRGFIELTTKFGILVFAAVALAALMMVFANQMEFQQMNTATSVARQLARTIDVVYSTPGSETELLVPGELFGGPYSIEIEWSNIGMVKISSSSGGNEVSAVFHGMINSTSFAINGPRKLVLKTNRKRVEVT